MYQRKCFRCARKRSCQYYSWKPIFESEYNLSLYSCCKCCIFYFSNYWHI